MNFAVDFGPFHLARARPCEEFSICQDGAQRKAEIVADGGDQPACGAKRLRNRKTSWFRKDLADSRCSLFTGSTSIEAPVCSALHRRILFPLSKPPAQSRPFLFVSVALFLMLNTGTRF